MSAATSRACACSARWIRGDSSSPRPASRSSGIADELLAGPPHPRVVHRPAYHRGACRRAAAGHLGRDAEPPDAGIVSLPIDDAVLASSTVGVPSPGVCSQRSVGWRWVTVDSDIGAIRRNPARPPPLPGLPEPSDPPGPPARRCRRCPAGCTSARRGTPRRCRTPDDRTSGESTRTLQRCDDEAPGPGWHGREILIRPGRRATSIRSTALPSCRC